MLNIDLINFIDDIDCCIGQDIVDRALLQGKLVEMVLTYDIPNEIYHETLLSDIQNNSKYATDVYFKIIKSEFSNLLMVIYREPK